MSLPIWIDLLDKMINVYGPKDPSVREIECKIRDVLVKRGFSMQKANNQIGFIKRAISRANPPLPLCCYLQTCRQ